MAPKSHVAVLQGGWSPEREISLISGQKCAEALQRRGYQVAQLDVDRDLAARLTELAPDVCFNALHGVGGEDGEVQGLLEVLAIPYTHSGVRASALAMDKHLSKKIFADAGLPVARSLLVMRGSCTDHPLDPPYVVKPVNQGSSVGVQIVPECANELPDTLTDSGWGYDNAAMVEAYIAGRELTCAVLDDAPTDVMEIVPTNGFYDYRAKYDEGGSAHILPADIPAALSG
ncbi:MAG: D-alanine--D-alanine ligase, partial [Pseudomonadota bacterium]|nr:D-alanine--D-alanine ligase [Pseudomonadota bacterium]